MQPVRLFPLPRVLQFLRTLSSPTILSTICLLLHPHRPSTTEAINGYSFHGRSSTTGLFPSLPHPIKRKVRTPVHLRHVRSDSSPFFLSGINIRSKLEPSSTQYRARPPSQLRATSKVIPKGYAVEYFPHKSQTITLEHSGCKKKWHPRLHVRPNRSGYILCGQWTNFVHDNKLKENDICIFQPIKGDSFRVIVHLLGKTSTHSRGSKSGSARKLSSAENSSSKEKFHGHRVMKESYDLDDSGEPSHPPPFVVLRHTSLTPAQEKIVDEEVKAIQSDVPIFVANMSREIVGDDGTFSLDFSSRYSNQHLLDGKQTLKLCRNGWQKAWLTKMLNKRMLPGEWCEFARNNRLCTGDLCLFEPMKDERLAMAVHIIRSEKYN